MFDALIPEGPLHPEHAIVALGFGLFVAVFAARRPAAWVTLTVAVFAVVVETRLDTLSGGGWARAAFVERDNAWVAVAALIGVPLLAAGRAVRPSVALAAVVGGCAGVWAVVPDTETALIAGAVAVGAAIGLPRSRPWRGYAALAVLPVTAAVVGSIGRTHRLEPALGVATLGASLAVTALMLVQLAWSRRWSESAQRAGTPTTVEPGSTSLITTAPAPTTAP